MPIYLSGKCRQQNNMCSVILFIYKKAIKGWMNSLNWKPQISMGGELKGTLKFSLYLNCNSHPINHIIMYHNMYVLYVYYMYIICHGENEDMHF